MSKKDEALLDEPTGLEDPEEYESSVRPVVPVDEDGKLVIFSFNRIENQDGKPIQYGFTAKNKIYMLVNFEISGGEYDSRRIGGMLGTQLPTFANARKATPADDFLHACSYDPPKWPTTNREFLNAIGETFGPFEATLNWELYCPDEPRKTGDKTGTTVLRGYNKFPLAEDGHTRKHEVDCPECGAFLVAQAKIGRFIIPRQ